MIGTEFEVWVCPECKGCTALPSIRGIDLKQQMNLDLKGDPTFDRAVCQNCSVPEAGKFVWRELHIAVVLRKVEPPEHFPKITEAEYFTYIEQQRRRAEE